MELRRFITDDFYLEATLDGGKIANVVGCSALIEMVEMNMVMVETIKTAMLFEVGKEIFWLSDEEFVIDNLADLLIDYELYCTNCDDMAHPVVPQEYIDEFLDGAGPLPKPLIKYFLKMAGGVHNG